MHRFEGVVPLGERPDAAGDGPHIQRARGDQTNDALPDWPVVTEAALQRNVFLHEPIEREADGLRPPTDLADPAAGTDEVECGGERDGNARGIDDAIGAQAI